MPGGGPLRRTSPPAPGSTTTSGAGGRQSALQLLLPSLRASQQARGDRLDAPAVQALAPPAVPPPGDAEAGSPPLVDLLKDLGMYCLYDSTRLVQKHFTRGRMVAVFIAAVAPQAVACATACVTAFAISWGSTVICTLRQKLFWLVVQVFTFGYGGPTPSQAPPPIYTNLAPPPACPDPPA